MQKTNIEWTDATWNPIRGCSRVSEGCRNCYAEKVAYRFSGPGKPYEGLVRINAKGERVPEWNGQVRLVEKHLLDPLKWGLAVQHTPDCERFAETREAFKMECKCPKRPRRIFVNSMSDLFHENVPDEWIDRIFAVMALCPQHQFQILTKRPERMLKYIRSRRNAGILGAAWEWVKDYPSSRKADREHVNEAYHPLPNVWLGVSVENQETADKRIPLLLQTPAAVRFISAEPLLRAVDLMNLPLGDISPMGFQFVDALRGWQSDRANKCGAGQQGQHLDWVIVGGESGPGARPMHPDWARSLRDQCQAAGVPFFFKQWGEWTPGENVERNTGTVNAATLVDSKWFYQRENLANDEGHIDDEPDLYRIGKHAAGALLDGREWREFPGARQ